MGFSPLGLIVAVAVLAPNLLMLWLPPHPPLTPVRVPRALEWLERAGQALCLVVPAITEPGALRWGWVVPALAALAAYYALWGRYLAGGRSGTALYRPLWGLPVPMAIFPVTVFLAASVWLSNGWLALSAVILAAGHIPAALIIARQVDARR
ncbi:hypothetical protein [Microbacterium sp. zg-YB36]|uniref:hypothetical protein n=1 Tax=Microbacterium sp. zg-YB36 TaxID=2969407 RepID=UPI00214CE79F|nr:hypothetical protein [Microbacterium sp. zg-YB36]MDL5353175.1 hypothetical protein [Microbacterium sp. zg-YB36]